MFYCWYVIVLKGEFNSKTLDLKDSTPKSTIRHKLAKINKYIKEQVCIILEKGNEYHVAYNNIIPTTSSDLSLINKINFKVIFTTIQNVGLSVQFYDLPDHPHSNFIGLSTLHPQKIYKPKIKENKTHKSRNTKSTHCNNPCYEEIKGPS